MEHRKRQKPYDIAHHHSLAVRCAEESAVLLQNDGILPLKIGQSVAVIGALAKEMRIQGGGSSHIHTRPLQTAVEALEAAGLEVHFAPGYTATPHSRTRHWNRRHWIWRSSTKRFCSLAG